jgi:hypothetical protein
MNTFITDNDPIICARNLDFKRLGKQRIEAIQILKAIDARQKGVKYGWINHPAVIMWISYENSLKYYTNCMINEWIRRGYKNTLQKFEEYSTKMPWWFTWNQLQESHQNSLLRKDFSYYKDIFVPRKEYENFTYVWPSKLKEEVIIKAKDGIILPTEEICGLINKKYDIIRGGAL